MYLSTYILLYFSFSAADKDGFVDLTDSTRCVCVTLISAASIPSSYYQKAKESADEISEYNALLSFYLYISNSLLVVINLSHSQRNIVKFIPMYCKCSMLRINSTDLD